MAQPLGRIRWDRPEWTPYFRVLFDRLGLKDWDFRIDETGPSDRDALAAIACAEGRKFARIDLSDNFLRDDEDRQRHAAVHEALHCHGAHAGHLLDKVLTSEQRRLWMLAHEYANDAIAGVLASFMPLPSDILDGPTRTTETPASADRINLACPTATNGRYSGQ